MTANIDNITELFITKPSDTPRISTIYEKHNYTTLNMFKKSLNENEMAILYLKTDLLHLSPILPVTKFNTENGKTPLKPLDKTDSETTLKRAATRIKITKQPTPFEAATLILNYNEKDNAHNKFRITCTVIKNIIINYYQ